MIFLSKVVVQLSSRLGVLVCGLLLTKWIIYNLTPQEYYNYSQITDLLTAFILVIISLSVPSLALRFYSQQEFRDDPVRVAKFWTTMLYLRIFSYFVGLAMLIVGLKIIDQTNWQLAIILYTAQFVLIADSIYKSITDATARSYTYGITDLIGKVAIVVVLFSVNYFDWITPDFRIYFFGLVLLGGYVLSLLLDVFWNKSYTKLGQADFSLIKDNSKSIFYFTATGFLSFVYISSFTYFLKLYNVDVLSYNSYITAFFKIFSTTATFGLILMPSIAVHFTEAYKTKNWPSLKKSLIKYSFVTTSVYILYAIASPVIYWLIDPTNKYPMTLQYAFWLLPLIGVYLTNSFINNITTLLHQEKWDFWVTIILFVINLIAQIILVPMFGVMGTITALYIVLLSDLGLKLTLLICTLNNGQAQKNVQV